MKILIVVILILAALVGFCTWVSVQVHEDSAIMSAWLNEAMDACRAGDWQKAETSWGSYAELWAVHKPHWVIWLRHMELDWVEQSYARAEAHLSRHNADLFISEVNVLIMIYDMIPQNEALRWDIIF